MEPAHGIKGDVYRHPSFEKAYAMGKAIGAIK